jgi:hypothetical protein
MSGAQRVKTARKDGRQVVVHCEVYPVNSLRVEPIRPGPYTFHSEEEATSFVDETSRALEYLGCTVS